MLHANYAADITACENLFATNLPSNMHHINEKDNKTESVVKVVGTQIEIDDLYAGLTSGIQHWHMVDVPTILAKVTNTTWQAQP